MSIVRLPGLNIVRAKGRRYVYLRATGYRFRAELGTPEFHAEYAAQAARAAPKAAPGTLGSLIDAYRAGPEFRGLAASTRADYDDVFQHLKPNGDMPLDRLTAAYVLGVRDRAFKMRKRRFANYCVQVLSLLCNWGRPRGFLESNPAHGVLKIRRPRDLPPANRPWTPTEQDAVLSRAPRQLRAPIALGLFAGLREGDAIALPWTAYDGQALRYRQRKTGALVELPAHPRLKAILDATPKAAATIATTTVKITTGVGDTGQRRPWTVDGFRASFFALIRELQSEGLVGENLTFHGLRHTVGQRLAEAGCDTRTIAAVLGHRSEAMARHYAEAEDRRRRTADAMRKVTRLERKKAGKLQNSGTWSAKPPQEGTKQ